MVQQRPWNMIYPEFKAFPHGWKQRGIDSNSRLVHSVERFLRPKVSLRDLSMLSRALAGCYLGFDIPL